MIRAARPDEAELVLALWRAADAAPSATDDVGGIRTLLAQDPDALLVWEDDGVIVGTLIAVFDGWRGHMYRLAVHPEHRRRGIARALIAHAEDRLRSLGCRRASALLIGEHDHARAAWQTAGYRHDERMHRFGKMH